MGNKSYCFFKDQALSVLLLLLTNKLKEGTTRLWYKINERAIIGWVSLILVLDTSKVVDNPEDQALNVLFQTKTEIEASGQTLWRLSWTG